MIIDQFVENLSDGDAISYHVFQLQNLIRKSGAKSRIYRNSVDGNVGVKTHHYSSYRESKKTNILIFHYSIYSKAFEYFKTINCKRKILYFHNVTPSGFFPKNNLFRLKHLEPCGYQIKHFQKVFNKAIADSTFNKNCLKKLGFKKIVSVIPPFVSIKDKFGLPYKKLRHSQINIIYVSQFNYHKRQSDVVKSFLTYNYYFNPKSNLYLVGGYYANPHLFKQVQSLASLSKNIYLTGKVSLEKLKQFYRDADVFISMSEHEGFGMPLIESMYFGIPIIAYETGAVAETLGKGGILVKKKDFLMIASLINALIQNQKLKAQIIKNQKIELRRFNKDKVEKALLKCLV